ncbi:MAG: hypothetical protein JWN14_2303 [Chthonomonadales bacterium]|nr:hypothetical protein [Chthonomonadales bacterium]
MNNNQRFAAELGVLFLFGAALWAKAAPKDEQPAIPKIVQAQEFRLVDAKGKVYARLARNPTGFDRHGREIKAGAEQTVLALYGKDANAGAVLLVVDPSEEPYVDLQRLKMKADTKVLTVESSQHAVLSSNDDGIPTLELSSEGGKQTTVKP